MSDNDLSILIKARISNDVKDIETQIRSLSAKIKEKLELKLKINSSDLQVLTKQIGNVQEKLKTNTITKGSQFINTEVERQAFQDITSRIREIRKNVDQLAKLDITTNKKGQITSATLTYYNKELGQTIKETMGWSEAQKKVNGELTKIKTFGTIGFKYSDNYDKVKQNIEKVKQAELKAQEQIRNALLKTEQTRRMEVEKSIQKQEKAIEKARQANLKAQQKEKIRIESLGEKVTGVGKINYNASEAELKKYAQAVAGAGAEIGKLTTKIDAAGRRIKEVNVRVKEDGKYWHNYKMVLDQSTQSLYRADRGLSDIRNRQISFNEAMKNAVVKITQWGIATSLVYGSLQQLRLALRTLKEIDTELVNIAKVTEYTNEQMKELTQTAINAGKEFGRTAQEYLKAMTAFARAGMGKQSEEYAKLSLLLQNVGDVTADTANETLIAANAGFQLGGSYEALMGVIDKFNNISNKNATDINKLSDAMKVGASVFHSAGMSMDETIAIIGTATASTQRSGSEISRAWRTILMNIRQVADEEAEVTVESMKKAEKALNSIGIVVRDTPSTFRPMFDIIKDLGESWNNLTEVEQAYVAESLAGKRQANVLISTLQNWSTAEKQLEESINASGSALRENEVYMQSWEARAKQFNVSMTSFWSNFINTDAVKSFISSLTVMINVLDKLINNSFSSFLIQTGLITTALTLVSVGFNALKSSLVGTTIGVIALDVAEKGLIVTTKALTAALLANPLIKIAVVAAGILGIVKAVDALTTSFKEQKEIVANLSSEINNLQTEYDQLKNKENRTDEEESYLKLLEKEIETKKELQKIETQELMDKEFFDGKSLGISKVNGYITSIKNLKEEFKNAETKAEADKLKEEIIKFDEKLIESQKSILNYKNILGEIPPELQALSDAIESILSSNDTSDTEKKLSGIAKGADNLSVSLESLQKTLSNGISNIESCNKALEEYNESGKFNLKTIIALAKDYPQLLNCLDDEGAIRQELISIIDQEEETQETAYANMLISSEKFYNAKILGNATLVESINSQYNEMFKQLGIEYEFDLEKFKSLALAKDEVESELIKELANKWAHYYDVASGSLTSLYTEDLIQSQEYAGTEIGDYMASQMSPFMKLYGELLKNRDRFQKIALDASGVDFSRINSSNINKLSGGSSSSSSSPIDYEDFLAELIRSYNYQVEIDKLQSSSLERQSKIAERAKDYNKTIELQNKLLDNQNKTITDLQSANEKIHQEAENVRNRNLQWDTETWFDINGEATVEYKNALNAYAGATDEASKAAHKNIQDTFKTLYNLKKAWRENTEEIERMGDAIYNTQTKITETLDKVKNTIQDEINKQVEEQIKLIESQKDTYIKSSKAKIASIQEELDAMDEQEEALQRQKSIEEQIQNISKANKNLLEARTKLTNIQNEKNTRIFQNGRWEYVADPKAVKDAKKEVEDAQQSLIDAQQSFNDKMAEIAAEDRRKVLQQEIDDQKKEQEIKEQFYNDQIERLKEFKDNFLEDFINGNIQLNEQTKKDFKTLGITYNEQLSKLFTIISTWSRQMRGQLQSVIDKKNEVGAGDLSITNTPIDSYDTGGEIDKTKLALVHKGEYMLNKSNVSALGGIKGVKNLLTSLPNLNLTSPIIPKLNINSIIPSNFRSSTSQVDKSVKINSVNLNHVYDVSSFMRNLTALAR